MSIEALKQALNALETIERFLDPLAKWQIRKPKDGGPMITVYPQKVAEEAINDLRAAIEQAACSTGLCHFNLTPTNVGIKKPWGYQGATVSNDTEAKLKENNT